jgi:NitT/TauT family transport system ATP-binding protein
MRDGPDASAVAIRNLAIEFPAATSTFTAVRNVDLALAAGEFAAIVGPSGCGKSTILNAIAGLLSPAAGSVEINGNAVTSVRSDVGYLFQRDALLPWKTVLENVMLPMRFRKVPRAEAVERARDWIRRVSLGGHEESYPHQLSGGMKKRVALATVFVYSPPILLMDEPFSALDVQTRQLMENELLDIWESYRPTVLFVTHDLEEAIGLAERVVVFTAGPGKVKQSYAVSLPRPRRMTEVRFTEEFREHHERIWTDLRDEVLTAYQRQMREG